MSRMQAGGEQRDYIITVRWELRGNGGFIKRSEGKERREKMGRDEREKANSAVIEMHFCGFAVMFKKV